VCASTGESFAHGDPVYSCVFVEDSAFERRDYSAQGWNTDLAGSAYSYWRANYVDPDVMSAEDLSSRTPLLKLFNQAAESEARDDLALAFLAAQLLRRQRVFRLVKETESAESGARVTLYTDRVANRLIEVSDFAFTYDELNAAREHLMTKLTEIEAEENHGEQPHDQQLPQSEPEPASV